MLEKYEAEPKL